jgi:hypothetical protein|uniref:DUF378 domain-containing protein n=1 Tax=viral metagenome TaxID=1070528 RepID=A0A6C0IE28_9ZZZZ
MNTALLVFFYLFLYISLIGALNWGLIGAFQFNLVEFVSNRSKKVERGLYIIVGLSALILFILSIIVISMAPETFEFTPKQDMDVEKEIDA